MPGRRVIQCVQYGLIENIVFDISDKHPDILLPEYRVLFLAEDLFRGRVD